MTRLHQIRLHPLRFDAAHATLLLTLWLIGCGGDTTNTPTAKEPITLPDQVTMEGQTWKLLPELPADAAQNMAEFFVSHPQMMDNAVASGDPHVYESDKGTLRCVWVDQWPDAQNWVYIEQQGRGWKSESGQGVLFE